MYEFVKRFIKISVIYIAKATDNKVKKYIEICLTILNSFIIRL